MNLSAVCKVLFRVKLKICFGIFISINGGGIMNDYIMQIVRACTYVHLSTNGADGYPETRHALRLFGFIEFVTDAATRNKYWRD